MRQVCHHGVLKLVVIESSLSFCSLKGRTAQHKLFYQLRCQKRVLMSLNASEVELSRMSRNLVSTAEAARRGAWIQDM